MDCFLGGLCNNDQKGVVRPEGGHHVNYSLKEGGGGGGGGEEKKKNVFLF